jgi:hypothetical protein
MSNVRRMDQSLTRNESKNQQLIATTTSITSLSSQTIQYQTSRLMRTLKPPPSYIVPNFMKVRDSKANTDTKPHAHDHNPHVKQYTIFSSTPKNLMVKTFNTFNYNKQV